MKRDDAHSWSAGPVVHTGAVVAVIASAGIFFSAWFRPGIDGSNHFGLISILARGRDIGALEYDVRPYDPIPYMLFYVVTVVSRGASLSRL